MSQEWATLRDQVLRFIARGWNAATDDATFDEIAKVVFEFQFEHNHPYRAWCNRRGKTPDTIEHWTGIPAVPTGAFKEVALVTDDASAAHATFRTSGTTLGNERRGTHYVRDLDLYHASLRSSFEAMLLPDGARPVMCSLLPPTSEMPDSSLVHMVDDVIANFGVGGSGHFATVAGGIDAAALADRLRECQRSDSPVCLLGTSLSFVHWLDTLAESDTRHVLPPASRLMDTGGFKGQRRAVPETELRRSYTHRLGLAAESCINEYGMTEMASQFYDSSLRDAQEPGVGERVRRKVGPAWVRTRVVDPDTLEPVSPGSTGLLQHFDVANAGTVMAIQTEDMGVVEGEGFRLLGRATGAPPRGCSIAMDELLSAARG
jgi:hypothetical protein